GLERLLRRSVAPAIFAAFRRAEGRDRDVNGGDQELRDFARGHAFLGASHDLVICVTYRYTLERTFERMATLPATRATRTRTRRNGLSTTAATRFDRRLGEILDHATEVFCVKGYEGSSMRDLSRATGMSLAGLYHYFQSKERLLFLIQ